MNPDVDRAAVPAVRVIVEQGESWRASDPGMRLVASASSLHGLRLRVAGYVLRSVPPDRVEPVVIDWVYLQQDGSQQVDRQVLTMDDLRRMTEPVLHQSWSQRRVDDYFRRRRRTAS